MKWILFFFCLLLLITISGCAPKVDQLAYNCPIITLPVKPIWGMQSLPTNAPVDLVLRTLVSDLTKAHGFIDATYDEIKETNEAEGNVLKIKQ